MSRSRSSRRSTGDPYQETASSLFGKKRDELSADEHRMVKTIAFGTIYGASSYRIGKMLSNERGVG